MAVHKYTHMTLDDVYNDLLNLAYGFGVDVDVPLESHTFFTDLVEQYHGDPTTFLKYVEAHMGQWFPAIAERPRWLQGADWQFARGRPMIFIGQHDVPAGPQSVFHDDASFYIFWYPEEGEVRTIVQVA